MIESQGVSRGGDLPPPRRYRSYPVTDGRNSLQHLYEVVSLGKVVKNFVVIDLCRYLPWLGAKNWLYRHLLKMKVGRHVSAGLMVMLDVFFPEMISIGDNTIIGYNTVILCHEFLVDHYRLGPVHIGKNVMIGANCTILPGVHIGDGAIVSACSLVNHDVPAYAMVGGVPARFIRWLTSTDPKEGGTNHGAARPLD